MNGPFYLDPVSLSFNANSFRANPSQYMRQKGGREGERERKRFFLIYTVIEYEFINSTTKINKIPI